MAHTYYSRLTIVHPQDMSTMDPRLGIVIAETATTGRFIIGDINWQSAVAPNADTAVAYMSTGDLKIYEPIGMSLFDYIRGAAYELGIENHLDARYLLEIEIIAEDFLNRNSPYKYIWPIAITRGDAVAGSKTSYSEKGSEYTIYFSHTAAHSQSNFVQPIKETITVKGVDTLEKCFTELQKELEEQEYSYAKARQKAGKEQSPGGNNPASADDYHDEFHFILDPKIKKFTLSNKGPAAKAIQGSFLGLGSVWGSFNVSIRPGSTLVHQITKILQSTNEIANLLPGRQAPAAQDATGSSERSRKKLQDQLGEIYKFFRVETATVYKKFDYIRGRYAVKHVFLIFLADQANMYQYPDEIEEYNKITNKSKVELKLRKYIQEGLLQKTYYHNYTGLNTDILKIDLNFNLFYALPSFPVIWADRSLTGPGAMNVQNYNRRINPYSHRDDLGVRQALNSVQLQLGEVNRKLSLLENEKKRRGTLTSKAETSYKQLKLDQEKLRKEEAERIDQLSAQRKQRNNNLNTVNNRSDLLNSLNFAEDLELEKIKEDFLKAGYPSLRPRMEPDSIQNSNDAQIENQMLIEKLYSVLVGPRDLVELELEIIADPYWLGVPNLLMQGNKDLDKIQLTAGNAVELKAEIESKMSKIDPDWSTRKPVWGDYGVAQWYKGTSLFYFTSKVPDNEFTDTDMLKFYSNDQIVGIYVVKEVVNEFKNGLWTQKLKAVKDVTIPSHVINKFNQDYGSFDNYKNYILNNPENLTERIINEKRREEEQRNKELIDLGIEPTAATVRNTIVEKVNDAAVLVRNASENDPPPSVTNPVQRANELVAQGRSKQEAYEIAKTEYNSQVNAYAEHMNAINKQVYAKAGITEYQPYDAKVMAELARTRSGNGGLEDWKNNVVNSKSPASNNNPAGIAYNSSTNSYTKFASIEAGLDAANEYFNYGQGVKAVGRQSQDRLLLPKEYTGDQSQFLKKKLGPGG